jgi:hypothetical protein
MQNVMIRHIALVKWKAEATAEQRVATIKRMRTLPEHIAEIRSYSVLLPRVSVDRVGDGG